MTPPSASTPQNKLLTPKNPTQIKVNDKKTSLVPADFFYINCIYYKLYTNQCRDYLINPSDRWRESFKKPMYLYYDYIYFLFRENLLKKSLIQK